MANDLPITIHHILGRGPSSSTLRFPPHPHPQQQEQAPSDPPDLASMARVPSPMQPLAHNLYTSYTQPEHGGYGGYTQPEHGYSGYHQPDQEIRSYNQDQEIRGYNQLVQETRGYGHPDHDRQQRPASIWSRFPSLPQQQQTVAAQVHSSTTGHGTLTRHNNNNHNLQLFHCAAELPRPTATVKPLTPPMSAAVAVVCDLPEPELGCGPDLNIPFANEHRGTIRLKTNPAEVFAEYEQQQHHYQQQQQQQQPAPADGGCGATKDELNDSGKSLLRTPTRAPNRSATDVMEDISSMLADLTTELDSMLTSDSVQ